MKPLLPLPLLLLVGLFLGVGPLRAEKIFEGDSLGDLRLGQSAQHVIKTLGPPPSKGEEVHWEAIGQWVQEWRYPKLGLTLAMNSAKKGGAKKTILNLTAEAPCQLATSRGIRIGSPAAALAKAYHDVRNKEEEGESGDLFVAGSVYGGVMFHLEAGKVARIFIGAAAE